jgi:ATP synthase in type III secretion protein N
MLLQMGEYRPGADALADSAVACAPLLEQHLRQAIDASVTFEDSMTSLRRAIEKNAPAASRGRP